MTTIEIDDKTAMLLNELAIKEHIDRKHLVERLIKKYSEESTGGFFEVAGIWSDRNINQDDIRETVWRNKTNDSL